MGSGNDHQEGYERGKLEGKIETEFKFNDKEHEMLFSAIKSLNADVNNLKIKAAVLGAMSGFGGAILTFLGTMFFKPPMVPPIVK